MSEQDWQPIATAPTDGQWFLVTSTHNPYCRGCVQWVDGVWIDWRDQIIDFSGTATHWTKLPDPPVAEGSHHGE